MRTFAHQAAQGDLLIIRVDAIPIGMTEVAPVDGRHIVAHSETGHDHWLRAIGVEHWTSPADPLVGYLRLAEATPLTHDRPHDTHAPIMVPAGTYQYRRQREYTPEGWRRVED